MLDTFKLFYFMVLVLSLTGFFLKTNGQEAIHSATACMDLKPEDNDNDDSDDDDGDDDGFKVNMAGLNFTSCSSGEHSFLSIVLLTISTINCETNNCLIPEDPRYTALLSNITTGVRECMLDEDNCEVDVTMPPAATACLVGQTLKLFIRYNYSCPALDATTTTALPTTTTSPTTTTTLPATTMTNTEEPAITNQFSGLSDDDEDSGLSQGGKIGIAVVACGVAVLLFVILIVCLVRSKGNSQKSTKPLPQRDLEGAVNTAYTNTLPEHIHYVPYDFLANPKPTSQYEEIPADHVTKDGHPPVSKMGEYAEINENGMSKMVGEKTAVENGVPKRDPSYAIPNKLVTNVAYQSLDDVPKDNYDNIDHGYLKLSGEGQKDMSRQQSVQRMVINEVYNK